MPDEVDTKDEEKRHPMKSISKKKAGKAVAVTAGVAAAATAGYVAYRKMSSDADDDTTIVHLLPSEEGWEVRREGAEEPESVHGTKDEGLGVARELAHSHEPSRLVVHRKDGSVQDVFSY
ncbi:MAG: DUF2188 domain-containing protein [Halobacteriales archaeon]|nr:DUF2188 domain-containing protein [Halobacteriales archaeon]